MKLFHYDFESEIAELENRIYELKEKNLKEKLGFEKEIKILEKQLEELLEKIYSNLTPWQLVQISRHPNRPYALDYINLICTDFMELHGDRCYGDDPSVIGGVAKLNDWQIMVLGQQKGRGVQESVRRNFGMLHPEGFRKALRLMKLAEKYDRPILVFIDTPGAYPGVEAEKRGQAQAIARNLMEMSQLRVPIVVVVIGEGGSGGALGMSVGDKILIQQYAYYSVISPEGCSAILWRDASKAHIAAQKLKLTPQDLLELGIVDEIIPEPIGGAHRNWELAAKYIKEAVIKNFNELFKIPVDKLLELRYQKYRNVGVFLET